MARAQVTNENPSAPSRRAFLYVGIPLTFVLAATVLAVAPAVVPLPLALPLALGCVLFLPGYVLETFLFGARTLTLTRLPTFFVFSLAAWALPATLLQLLGANWSTFRAGFVLILWALTIAACVRVWRAPFTRTVITRRELGIQFALAGLCVGAALIVAPGPRDADDWTYLQITQQLLGSDSFEILAASEARYSIRYAFHVWIFLQAFLGHWLNADVVTLLRDTLPVLLAPLGLVSFYAWGRTFFGRAGAAFGAVLIQLLIYVTFVTADGWGRGFFARSAQDKFLVWLVILPVALAFAWQFLREGNFRQWFAFGAAMVAGLWVHPVSLYLVVLTLGGFALFNLLSRAPFPRRRWLLLTVASLPALLSPLVIRATTLSTVFRVDIPEVAAYIRLSEGRLLFQPPLYLADPALIAHPLILFAFALLILFAPRVRSDTRVQYLWGSTLIPLALLFHPFTARLLGEMLTPWQLWRMTWNLPVAFILVEAFTSAPVALAHTRAAHCRKGKCGGELNRLAFGAAAVGIIALAAVGLSNVNYARSFANLTKDHALAAPVEDMLRRLERRLNRPSMVLLPRDLTRFAPAYTFNARVMSNDAQKEEDTTGKQIDRFYDPKADPKFLDAFLNFWQIHYVVAPNDSLQDSYMRSRPATTLLYRNAAFTLYQTQPQSRFTRE